jgi:hypothetical protein
MAKSTDRERDRVFQVSSNRGGAQHKLRYVEASVSTEELQDCRMCRVALTPQQGATSGHDDQAAASKDDQPNS